MPFIVIPINVVPRVNHFKEYPYNLPWVSRKIYRLARKFHFGYLIEQFLANKRMARIEHRAPKVHIANSHHLAPLWRELRVRSAIISIIPNRDYISDILPISNNTCGSYASRRPIDSNGIQLLYI